MKIKTVIVTGGAGYIGSHVCVSLIEAGYTPVVIDNLCNSNLQNVNTVKTMLNVEFPVILQDCTDYVGMSRAFENVLTSGVYSNLIGVIHLAAFKSVGKSVKRPLDYYKNNVGSMEVVLRCMKEQGLENLVFSSSCTVYGQPKTLPVVETMTLEKAEAPYGRSKQICEDMINDCVKAHELRAITLRYFNPIGAHPTGLIGELPLGDPENLVPYITQVAMGLREKLTIFGGDYSTRDGTCVRGYVHVMDIADAHVQALKVLEAKHTVSETFERIKNDGVDVDDQLLNDIRDSENRSFNQVHNLGVGNGCTVLELVKAFEKETGIKLNYEIGPRRPGDVEAIYADASSAMRFLSWKPRFTINDAVSHAWKWQCNYASWK